MKHLGDITKISGYDAPIVDCIIGGSPCQDLSVAGKQTGLAGERSGLFMEQIRIIKEMRENDRRNGRNDSVVRPRYMVWENVPGAFSSNKGEDFRVVLEETAKIADENAVIPKPPKGKWATSGCIVADGWSIAWRVFDAQFWGVPQRRKRIALVADFGGLTAPEILFERQGVPGYIKPCGKERQSVAGNTESRLDTAGSKGAYCIQGNCIDRADTAGCNGKGWTEGVSYTLNTIDRPAVLPFVSAPQLTGGGACFVSLFCGSCSVESKVTGYDRIILNDKHKYLIALLRGVQAGYELPETITEEQYQAIRADKDADPVLAGFAGFGCSFGGKWFGGYARNKGGTNYAAQSKRSLLKDMATLGGAEIFCGDYKQVPIPPGAVVYADPPYADTTGYNGEKFDSKEFWRAMRLLADTGHTVYISEQTAPPDFVCVWEKPFTRTLDRNKGNQFKVTEKLFTYISPIWRQ